MLCCLPPLPPARRTTPETGRRLRRLEPADRRVSPSSPPFFSFILPFRYPPPGRNPAPPAPPVPRAPLPCRVRVDTRPNIFIATRFFWIPLEFTRRPGSSDPLALFGESVNRGTSGTRSQRYPASIPRSEGPRFFRNHRRSSIIRSPYRAVPLPYDGTAAGRPRPFDPRINSGSESFLEALPASERAGQRRPVAG